MSEQYETNRSRQRPTIRQRSAGQQLVAATVLFAFTWQPILIPEAKAAFSPPMIQLFDAPFLVGERVPPFVMLAVTKDQQLFKKAYDDFSDLNRDGVTDTTYDHRIDYYGHFDSFKCYVYNDGTKRFEPSSITGNKYCSGQWSGNFLNWATMTRMDALRKVLYGGLRSPNRSNGDGSGLSDGDTASSTVIERAYLPNDAHSFTKYYDGEDTNRLTPFENGKVDLRGTPRKGSNDHTETSIDADPKRVSISSHASFPSGEWVQLTAPNGSYVRGTVTHRGNSSGSDWIEVGNIQPINIFVAPGTSPINAVSTEWRVTNIRTRGLTICNTTDGATSGDQALSDTNTNLPRMKVARGNFSLWNAAERWQCRWREDKNASNGNDPAKSGLMAFSNPPYRDPQGLDPSGKGTGTGRGDYFVRTQVCVPSLLGTERCKQYPAGGYKPVGLLQIFGEPDRIRFGLMTGSYSKNLSGGVLRKNISRLSDEINVGTDGTFVTLGAGGVGPSPAPGDSSATLEGGSIINTLSKLRIAGYEYRVGTYFESPSDDNCPYQRALDENDDCKSWGNPISEIFYEGLRYFGGQTTPTTAFHTTDDATVIAGLATAKWPDNSKALLSQKNYCAPLNILVVNGAVSTNERDGQIGSLGFMDGSPGTAVQLTNNVGNIWGLSGSYFFGQTSGATSGSSGYQICSGKSLTGLGEAFGICPEGPTLNGSYLIAGLAHHAHTNRVRTDITLPASAAKLKRPALHVDTYGVSIAGGIPRIPVKFKDETSPRVVIQPAYRLTNGTYGGGGALVDARIIRQVEEDGRSYGQIMVSWEDSEAGGDYDMDVWGLISYEMDSATSKIKVTTDAIYDATSNPQGFGYVISGTDRDGLHFHSGILNFSYTDPMAGMVVTGSTKLNASGGCQGCTSADGPTTAEYNLTTNPPAKSLEDPLYYASLFGGFEDTNGDKQPTPAGIVNGVAQPSEFDKRNNYNGTDTPDGIPDNYFKVDNPLGLELGLERTFQLISEQSSLSSLQASSTRIVSGSSVFQAKFNSGDWSGSLESLPIATGGVIGVAQWNAATASLSAGGVDHANRVVYTMRSDSRLPIPFRYASLAPAQQAVLDKLPSGSSDSRGIQRVNYLRGDNSQEGVGSAQFRRRASTVLGDIVNSSPAYVGKPTAGIGSASYLAFIAANSNRTPMIYVGANDGMLHGFSATNGHEVFAYVPTPVVKDLNQLPMQDYQHRYFVDGQLAVQDIELTPNVWRTYLVGGLGRGGQGVFGLDVTNPAGASDATASQIVKWEFTDADDPHMGYLFSSPIIRKTNGGVWYAIFSSGYNAGDNGSGTDTRRTSDGQGAIFMLKMSGPTGANGRWTEGVDYIRIDIPEGTAASPNGIGGVASFDKDGNGTSDLLYAGDLQGNLWRVDISSATATAWASEGNQRKLFKAVGPTTLAQPITAPPSLAVGPNYKGAMVVFGTGRLLEPADLAPGTGYQPNTLYGIWDKQDGSTPSITRGNLMRQEVLAKEANGAYAGLHPEVASIEFSLLSAYVPNYTAESRPDAIHGNTNPFSTSPTANTPPQMGWYLDEPNGALTGERTIYRPELVGPFSVFVNAIPSAVACEGGGSEAQYVLETLTGGRSNFGGFDRDANGAIQAQSGSLLGDQSQFNLPGSTGNEPAYFFASRRETTGGFGQMTIMADAVTSASGGGACAGAGLAPIGAQSFSSGLIGTQRLPGGCIGRVQWREVINH